MNVLPREKRLAVLAALVDGSSERAAERMTGANRITVSRVALRCGQGAARLHNRIVRGLSCSLIQADEIWSYIGKKQKRVDPEKDGPEVGEAYTFVGLCGASKLVISFHVGKRDQINTDLFMSDLRSRLITMPMMVTDGFTPYASAVGAEFGESIDYGVMKKNYRAKPQRDDHRYEPPRDPFIMKKTIFGAPDHDKLTTYAIERNNGTTRHFTGRMRRLVYAFSKDIEHHKAAVALTYAYYNLCWVVKTLKVTPAMAAGLTDHVWSLEEFLDVIWNEPETEKPVKVPLVHTKPEGTARELPNGRGFLRALPGRGPASPSAPALPPSPAAPAALPPAPAGSSTNEAPATRLHFESADECLAFFGLKPEDKGGDQ